MFHFNLNNSTPCLSKCDLTFMREVKVSPYFKAGVDSHALLTNGFSSLSSDLATLVIICLDTKLDLTQQKFW